MTGRSTKGYREKGHGIGDASVAVIGRSVDVTLAALHQASQFAMEGDAESARVAIAEAFGRIKQIHTDLVHAAACETELPCRCQDCTTPEDRIQEARAERLALENHLLRTMQQAHVDRAHLDALKDT